MVMVGGQHFFEQNFLPRYVNKQNCRICGSEDPQVIEQRLLHPESHCLVRRCDWLRYRPKKAVENYLKRINACNTSCGGNLNDVVFPT